MIIKLHATAQFYWYLFLYMFLECSVKKSRIYMIDSVEHPDSIRHPLTSLSQITVGLRSMADLLLRVRAYVSDVIGR